MMTPGNSTPSQNAALHPSDVPTEGELKCIYLFPGSLHVTAEPCEITTILGSCVSLCLWDKQRHIGGVNHYILPEGPKESRDSPRYGNIANQTLLRKLQSLGCHVEDLQGKIFGGATAFAAVRESSVGAQNVKIAEEFLDEWKIPLLLKETLGRRGRRLTLRTTDGATWLKVFADPESKSRSAEG